MRLFYVRPRLLISVGIALMLGFTLPASLIGQAISRALIAWNVGCALYVLLAVDMMRHSSDADMHRRARLQDEGKSLILFLTALAAVASLAAIAGELAVVKELRGWPRTLHILLAGCTVLNSWAFIQMMFALHYAHEYVVAEARGLPPVLLFPGADKPGYGDFFYFAAVIGTSGQTADASFASSALRRTGTLHCVLSYLFNTTVLALLINIGAGLF